MRQRSIKLLGALGTLGVLATATEALPQSSDATLSLQQIGEICSGVIRFEDIADDRIEVIETEELNGSTIRKSTLDGGRTRIEVGPIWKRIKNVTYEEYVACVSNLSVTMMPSVVPVAEFDCEPSGGAQGSTVERRVLFHNQGSYYSSEKEYEKAVVCFKKALTFNSRSVGSLNDLAIAYWNLDRREDSIEALERATAYELNRMKSFDNAVFGGNKARIRMIESMGCVRRSDITDEIFGLLPWENLARFLYTDGHPDRAASSLTPLIEHYPEKSCWYEKAVGPAFHLRGQYHCINGEFDQAESDYREALRLKVYVGDSAKNIQRALKDAGLYTGNIDGSFGSGSQSAMWSWAAKGCPGIES